ncbi:MAG: J domain-containing protein [bacterium]|nr:J domain-containing protein [bacterium]
MVITLKDWLKRQLDSIISVQITQPHSEHADLVVHSWNGYKIYIHTLDQVPKPRTIRKALQDATEIGVGSLFLLDTSILPQDGHRTRVEEWAQTLHTLTGERLYATRTVKGVPEVFQVHLEPLSNGEHMAWYGPLVEFSHLRFFKTSIKQPRAAKGDWFVADFGGGSFWRNTDYRSYRAQRDAEIPRQRQTHWQTWEAYGQTWAGMADENNRGKNNGNSNSNGAYKSANATSAITDYLEVCFKLLGLDISADKDAVKTAFRKLAIVYHPDTSELPDEEASAKFHALNKAYDYIKTARGWH